MILPDINISLRGENVPLRRTLFRSPKPSAGPAVYWTLEQNRTVSTRKKLRYRQWLMGLKPGLHFKVFGRLRIVNLREKKSLKSEFSQKKVSFLLRASHRQSPLDITYHHNLQVSGHSDPLGALMLKASVFRLLKTHTHSHTRARLPAHHGI